MGRIGHVITGNERVFVHDFELLRHSGCVCQQSTFIVLGLAVLTIGPIVWPRVVYNAVVVSICISIIGVLASDGGGRVFWAGFGLSLVAYLSFSLPEIGVFADGGELLITTRLLNDAWFWMMGHSMIADRLEYSAFQTTGQGLVGLALGVVCGLTARHIYSLRVHS